MKKYFASAAALCALSGAASAADDVTVNGITIYGTVDIGLAYQTHSTPNSPYTSAGAEYLVTKSSNSSIFGVAPNGLSHSKIGIKGIEELVDGWSGLFKLETGFQPASGQLTDGPRSLQVANGVPLNQQFATADSSHAGQIFNRAAYAGVTNKTYGTLTVGRQTTLQADGISAYDPQQGSYAFSLIGYSGTAGGAGATEDLRLDNSVKYVNSYGPARIGLMYQAPGSVGRDGGAVAANLGGDYAGFSIDAIYTRKKDEISAGSLTTAQLANPAQYPINSITATVSDNTAYSVMGKYSMERAKFYAGYEYIKFQNPTSPIAGTTAIPGTNPVQYLPGTINIGGYLISSANNTAYTNNKILQYAWAGARYYVTEKLEVAGAFYHIDQNSYRLASAGGSCNKSIASTCSGQEFVGSLVLNYHVSNRFDTYVGAMYSQVVDGLANGYLHNNNVDPTIGVRFNF